MSASFGGRKKASQKGTLAPVGSAVRFSLGRGRWVMLPLIAAGIAAAGSWMLWQHVREDVLAEPEYKVTYDRIELTPPPPWIHSPIKEPALRDASLDEPLSLMDPELPARIARALELHPWVAKVERVTPQYPARIIVELSYRQPVCMVELPAGYYPVDAEATLLPTDDFTSADPQHYPQLRGIESPPLGMVGSRWDEPRVVGGAAVAATLVENWEPWNLAAILPSGAADGGHNGDEYTYRLVTDGGTEIIWGNAPGREVSPEPDAARKISRLAARYAERGSLDDKPDEEPLDLRSNVVAVPPRTAAKP